MPARLRSLRQSSGRVPSRTLTRSEAVPSLRVNTTKDGFDDPVYIELFNVSLILSIECITHTQHLSSR